MARPKPLAELIDRCIAPALAAQGFAASDIILAWPDIVGERLARYSEPVRVDWPRRRRHMDPDERSEPATLVVRVTSAFALDMQHLAPIVIERVNGHFGWRCIGRLALRQGPVERRPATRQAPPPLDPAGEARVSEAVADVEDERLREALARLGRGVLSRR